MAALEFDHISKHYRGARRSYHMLRDDLRRLLPGRAVDSTGSIRALDDVSFSVREGESFALIGRNGVGKTTALKLATRISFPTSGKLRVRGRVGALIEVSTGLHPELTGRENIQLYGRILGLKRREIKRRFDEIVDFAEIGPALEQPVKQYSSGMQLRLGFSLAAHVEPDLFLVDEAIAVGDVAFQHRCVERMGELVREGRTLGFVSHDMSAVESLCDRAILLESGKIAADGPAREVVKTYLESVESEFRSRGEASPLWGSGPLTITRVTIHDASGAEVGSVDAGSELVVRIHYRTTEPLHDPIFEVGITDGRAGPLALASMLIDGQTPGVLDGDGFVECRFEKLPLLPRTYEVWGGVRTRSGHGELVVWQRLALFRLQGEVLATGKGAVSQLMTSAPVRVDYSWDVQRRD